MKQPWCEFCHKVVKGQQVIDYDELHAIECGIGDGLLVFRSDARAWALHQGDWHYYILARGVTTILTVVGFVLLIGAVM